MPKNKSGGGVRTTRVPFRTAGIYISSSAAGFTGATLDMVLANISARIAAMVYLWKKWRFSKPLRVKAMMDQTTQTGVSGAVIACGFYGGPATTVNAAVNSIGDIVELTHASMGNSIDPARFSVPLSALHGAATAPWLYSSFNGIVDELYTCGSLFVGLNNQAAQGVAVRVWVTFAGELEFCDPVDPTVGLSIGDDRRTHDEEKVDETAHGTGPWVVPPVPSKDTKGALPPPRGVRKV